MSKQPVNSYVISFKCPDRLGVVALFAQLLYDNGAFITESAHHSDPSANLFFARTVFDDRSLKTSIEDFSSQFEKLAAKLKMDYRFRNLAEKPRVLVAVSRQDHCLSVLLNRWKSGVLPGEIVGVISNHDSCRDLAEWYGLPFYQLPITETTKPAQEAEVLSLVQNLDVDLLVLARYMQILSDNFCQQLPGKIINIHHSFLPGFKGARPYHQAYQRGVKIIGATAHYVTPDLDEGPIIVQEVKPVTHAHSAEDMVHMGHDIEAIALYHAVKLHLQERVMLSDERTIIL